MVFSLATFSLSDAQAWVDESAVRAFCKIAWLLKPAAQLTVAA
jgi:hypothetical protein